LRSQQVCGAFRPLFGHFQIKDTPSGNFRHVDFASPEIIEGAAAAATLGERRARDRARAFREAGHVADDAADGLDGYAIAREGAYDVRADGRMRAD